MACSLRVKTLRTYVCGVWFYSRVRPGRARVPESHIELCSEIMDVGHTWR